jgi:hypothetical protein
MFAEIVGGSIGLKMQAGAFEANMPPALRKMVIRDPAVSIREIIFSWVVRHQPAHENEAAFVRFRKRLNRTRIVVATIVRNDRTSGDGHPILCRFNPKAVRK